MTLARAMINLGSKEMSLGLTYVAFSRVKTPDGIMLVGDYTKARFEKANKNSRHQYRVEAENKLDRLGSAQRE